LEKIRKELEMIERKINKRKKNLKNDSGERKRNQAKRIRN